jgi:hypothetical protein
MVVLAGFGTEIPAIVTHLEIGRHWLVGRTAL